MSANATPRRTSRFRFTLRALFVFITLFMLWGGYHTNHAWRERRAEKVLLDRGAKINYGPAIWESSWSAVATVAYQRVVGRIWGERYILSVSLTSSLEPDVVNALAELPHLRTLTLAPAVRRNGDRRLKPGELPPMHAPSGAIERILRGHRLLDLHLNEWRLSEADILAISCQRHLRTLNLDFTGLSDEGLAKIIVLPRLQSFSFESCWVTGSTLAPAPGSATLEQISCREAPLGVEFAAYIARSPQVRSLLASGESIGDEFVIALGPHPKLETLLLMRTNITEESIRHLERLPSLNTLHVPADALTPEAEARLRKARPKMNF